MPSPIVSQFANQKRRVALLRAWAGGELPLYRSGAPCRVSIFQVRMWMWLSYFEAKARFTSDHNLDAVPLMVATSQENTFCIVNFPTNRWRQHKLANVATITARQQSKMECCISVEKSFNLYSQHFESLVRITLVMFTQCQRLIHDREISLIQRRHVVYIRSSLPLHQAAPLLGSFAGTLSSCNQIGVLYLARIIVHFSFLRFAAFRFSDLAYRWP